MKELARLQEYSVTKYQLRSGRENFEFEERIRNSKGPLVIFIVEVSHQLHPLLVSLNSALFKLFGLTTPLTRKKSFLPVHARTLTTRGVTKHSLKNNSLNPLLLYSCFYFCSNVTGFCTELTSNITSKLVSSIPHTILDAPDHLRQFVVIENCFILRFRCWA